MAKRVALARVALAMVVAAKAVERVGGGENGCGDGGDEGGDGEGGGGERGGGEGGESGEGGGDEDWCVIVPGHPCEQPPCTIILFCSQLCIRYASCMKLPGRPHCTDDTETRGG